MGRDNRSEEVFFDFIPNKNFSCLIRRGGGSRAPSEPPLDPPLNPQVVQQIHIKNRRPKTNTQHLDMSNPQQIEVVESAP